VLIENTQDIKYDAMYDFHEHGQTTGFLLYYYSNKNKELTNSIINMLRSNNIPLENKYVDIILKSNDGIIYVPFYAKWYFMLINNQATTGLYFNKIKVKEVYVIETPKILNIEKRKEIIELILKYILEI
jgi:hypothetical protein